MRRVSSLIHTTLLYDTNLSPTDPPHQYRHHVGNGESSHAQVCPLLRNGPSRESNTTLYGILMGYIGRYCGSYDTWMRRSRLWHSESRHRYCGYRNLQTGLDHEGSCGSTGRGHDNVQLTPLSAQSLIPIVMAGIIAVYALVISVLIAGNPYLTPEGNFALSDSFNLLGAGASVGGCGLAAGYAIGIVGDAVREERIRDLGYRGKTLSLIHLAYRASDRTCNNHASSLAWF